MLNCSFGALTVARLFLVACSSERDEAPAKSPPAVSLAIYSEGFDCDSKDFFRGPWLFGDTVAFGECYAPPRALDAGGFVALQ